jgi:hypothetical protein
MSITDQLAFRRHPASCILHPEAEFSVTHHLLAKGFGRSKNSANTDRASARPGVLLQLPNSLEGPVNHQCRTHARHTRRG